MTGGDAPPGPPLPGDEGLRCEVGASGIIPGAATSSPPRDRGAGGAARARSALASPVAAERAAALDWLGTHAPEAFTLEDATLLRDPDLAVRAAAAVALRVAAEPALVNGARLALRTLVEGDAAERHAGLRAAALLGNPTLAPRLLPYLAHPEPETRRLTLLALAAAPPGLLAPTFLRDPLLAALRDPAADVRATARALLDAGGGAGG